MCVCGHVCVWVCVWACVCVSVCVCWHRVRDVKKAVRRIQGEA